MNLKPIKSIGHKMMSSYPTPARMYASRPESGRIDVMSRRFQFSLRTLLVAVAMLCIVLGGKSLASRVAYVEAMPTAEKDTLLVRGRMFSFLGPESAVWTLLLYRHWDMPIDPQWAASGTVSRSLFAFYDVELEIPRPLRPGEYALMLGSIPETGGCMDAEGLMIIGDEVSR
jgi:hypothetical protein